MNKLLFVKILFLGKFFFLYLYCFYYTKFILLILPHVFYNFLLLRQGSVFGSSRKLLAQAAADAICFTKECREALI